jgi:hypothetical protein
MPPKLSQTMFDRRVQDDIRMKVQTELILVDRIKRDVSTRHHTQDSVCHSSEKTKNQLCRDYFNDRGYPV